MPDSAYLRALENAVRGAGLPYGYAVTVWSTGANVTGQHGMPSVIAIFLFVAGATAGFGGLRLLTWNTATDEAERPLARSPRVIRAGIVHVVAIGAAVGAAALIARIHGDVAWALAPLASTLVYLGGSSVEVALVERGRRASA